MLISEAKEVIKKTIKMYLQKDEAGCYIVPTSSQRPVLLYGAPGIGKTAIMSQIADELGIGLLSYTITHHTRQSAIGLPYIVNKNYQGRSYAVTEYTLSEIIASVYEKIEKTKQNEGILFIDEINCVSETLAPAMLDLLQNKKFGPHEIPKGWILVACGNPKEYNKSVKDFDVVTLDRVKRLDVDTDFDSFSKYAINKNIHESVLYYLQLKPQNLLVFEKTIEGMLFATPRGWEDLSTAIISYNKLGYDIDQSLISQYIQHPQISLDFINYYNLYMKYKEKYDIKKILEGDYLNWQTKISNAKFDEKLAVIELLLEYINRKVNEYNIENEAIIEYKKLSKEEINEKLKEISEKPKDASAFINRKMQRIKQMINQELDVFTLETNNNLLKEEIIKYIDNSIMFLDDSLGKSHELYLYLVNILNNINIIMFITRNKVSKFYKYNALLINNSRNKEILKDIESLQN